MPKLPDTVGQRAIPSGQRRVWQYDNDAAIQAAERAGQATERAGNDLAAAVKVREQEEEKDAILDAVRRDNEAQQKINSLLYGDDKTEGLYAAQGANALNSQSVFQERFKAIKDQALDGVSNQTARVQLEKSLMSMETGTLGNVQRFVQDQRKGYTNDLLKGRIENAQNRVGMEYNNADTLNAALTEVGAAARNMAKVNGWKEGDAAWTSFVNAKEAAIYETQVTAMINKGDAYSLSTATAMFDQYKEQGKIKDFATLQKLDNLVEKARPKVDAYNAFSKMSAAQMADPLGFIIKELEGGDKIVTDTGGLTKGGISQKAHPDVDIANLTEAEQRAIYQKDYIDAYGIGELPPDMQVLAMDTVINHRSGFKEDVIKAIKGGASRDEIFSMRLKEYERLAKEDPAKYGEYLKGWKNRLGKLYNQMNNGLSATVIDAAQAETIASGLTPEARTEYMSMVENHNKSAVAMQKEARRSVVDEALPAIMSGGIASVSPDVLARAEEYGVLNDLVSYKAETDKDTALYLYSLAPAALADLDISDPSIRLKLSPADYEKWKNKKEKLGNASNIYTQEKRQSMVSAAFQKRNISTKTDEGKLKAFRMNEMLDLEIDAFSEANNGRYPNQAELTKIVDGLFIKGDFDTSWWWGAGGGNEYVFDIEIDELPKKDRTEIEDALRRKGVAVTDSAIIKTWLKQNYGQ